LGDLEMLGDLPISADGLASTYKDVMQPIHATTAQGFPVADACSFGRGKELHNLT
jgi:hypothetical protein